MKVQTYQDEDANRKKNRYNIKIFQEDKKDRNKIKAQNLPRLGCKA